MMFYGLRCMRLTLVFCRRPRGRRAGGSAVRLPQRSLRSEDGRTAEAAPGVWEGQRCAYRNGACGVRTGARLRPLCPWSKAPDGLPGGGLRAFFRREAPGLGLWGWDVCGAGGRCRKADGMERVRVAAF